MTIARLFLGQAGSSWDITKATYLSKSFSVSAQSSKPRAFQISADGLYAYVLDGYLSGAGTNTIYQYNVFTAFDITTASFRNSFSVNAQATLSSGLLFKPDGTTFYVVNIGNGAITSIFQYTCSTPWDTLTASYASKVFNYSLINPFEGIFIKSDGTVMFALIASAEEVRQFSISTPWDISTASYAGLSLSVISQVTQITGISVSSDGTKLFVMGLTPATIFEYTLPTPWSLSGASYSGKSKSVSAQDTSPCGLMFNAGGSGFYISGATNKTIYQYGLT